MKKLFDPRFKRYAYELMAGEYYATADPNVVLVTLVGSCIAVCLLDEKNGVIGMNHFMLPGKFNIKKHTNDARYGIHAIEMLIKEMVKVGADRGNLKAKIFGAGRMMVNLSMDIGGANELFVRKFLPALDIPIVAADLGGNYGRKIYFFSNSKQVFMKRIGDSTRVTL